MSNEVTLVVFRTYPWGDVIALFPELPADPLGTYCECYQHIGQHGSADYHQVIYDTRPSDPTEYEPLLSELRQLGYRPIVRKRVDYRTHQRRRQRAIAG